MEKRICAYCNKKLSPIKNDWESRKYHTKCYKFLPSLVGYVERKDAFINMLTTNHEKELDLIDG